MNVLKFLLKFIEGSKLESDITPNELYTMICILAGITIVDDIAMILNSKYDSVDNCLRRMVKSGLVEKSDKHNWVLTDKAKTKLTRILNHIHS